MILYLINKQNIFNDKIVTKLWKQFTFLDRFEDEARKFGKQLSTQFIFNGFISVGNFFFLSGLVVTYISVPMFKRTGAPTLFSYISMRWFRFMPSMIGIICFHILWPLMGSGPVFKKYANELTEPCSRNWWTNILFINNWLLLPDMVWEKYYLFLLLILCCIMI